MHFSSSPPSLEYFCWQAPVIIAEPERRHFIFNLERVKLCPWSSLTRLLQCDRMKCCRNGQAMELLPPVTENRSFIFSRRCGFIYLRVQVKVAPPNTHSLSHTHTLQQSQPGGRKWSRPLGFGKEVFFFFFFLGQDTLYCPPPPPSLPQLEEEDKSS